MAADDTRKRFANQDKLSVLMRRTLIARPTCPLCRSYNGGMVENPYQSPAETTTRQHSAVGAASFLLACSMAVLFVVLLGISALIDARRGSESLESLASTGVVLFLIGNLTAIVLGIIAFVQKGSKKLPAAGGLTLACLLIGCLVLLVVYSEPRPLGGPVRIQRR